jgi:hypothetical protein
MKMKLGVSIIVVSYTNVSRSRLCSHTTRHTALTVSIRMDPLDLDLINDLLEGEANLKEVNGFRPMACSKIHPTYIFHTEDPRAEWRI